MDYPIAPPHLEALDKTLAKYRACTEGFGYVENGILLMEGLAFCAMADELGVDLVIESGVAGGGSTEIWASYFSCPIFAIEFTLTYGKERFEETKRRLHKYPHITFIEGDSFFVIENLVRRYPDKRIALFVDGPKGNAAVALVRNMLSYSNVVLAALHDQGKPSSPAYHSMDGMDGLLFYTDQNDYARRYLHLDLDRPNAALTRELNQFPNGPGLGLAGNPAGAAASSWETFQTRFAYHCHRTRSWLFAKRYGFILARLIPEP